MISTALNAVRQKLFEHFDTVTPLPESEGLSVNWVTPDGTTAILTALVTRRGNIRIEFTRNLVEGITEPTGTEDTIFIRLKSDTKLKLWNHDALPIVYGTFNMTRDDHTIGLLIDMIDTLINTQAFESVD